MHCARKCPHMKSSITNSLQVCRGVFGGCLFVCFFGLFCFLPLPRVIKMNPLSVISLFYYILMFRRLLPCAPPPNPPTHTHTQDLYTKIKINLYYIILPCSSIAKACAPYKCGITVSIEVRLFPFSILPLFTK